MLKGQSKRSNDKENVGQRSRFLNIIYFVDSNRTHSFKLPVKRAQWMLFGLIATVIWAIGSATWLTIELRTSHAKSLEINKLMATIFDYQTRYDQVYERTYPKELQKRQLPAAIADNDSGEKPALAEEEKESEEIKESEKKKAIVIAATKPVEEKKEKIKEKKKAVKEPEALAAKERSIKIEAKKAKTKKGSPILIDQPTHKSDATGLTLSFAIKNRIGPNKAEGRLWGVATYTLENGSTQLVSAPFGIDPSDKGIPSEIRKARSFRIRYYKLKQLFFERPSVKGSFTKIEVYCADNDEKKYHLQTIPIDKENIEEPKESEPKKEEPKDLAKSTIEETENKIENKTENKTQNKKEPIKTIETKKANTPPPSQQATPQ